ncbi:MAG: methylglyoxal synthase [Oscillospiraceae bacterium]|nr:methylglyoxal synthase [Oscillospiraceae bacterium]
MNIAIIAHDKKKELMVQFCIAYYGVFSKHNLFATRTTGELVEEATKLSIKKFLSGSHGGVQQIAANIAVNDVDILFFFRDPDAKEGVDDINILHACDKNTIPVATNIATAESIIHALEQGYLGWIEIEKENRNRL